MQELITIKEIFDYRNKRKKEIMKIRDEYKGFKHENGQHIDLLFGHIDTALHSAQGQLHNSGIGL